MIEPLFYPPLYFGMQATRQAISRLLRHQPSAGALGAMCEENYSLLTALMPTLASMQGCFCMQPHQHPMLAMQVVRDGPYTQKLLMTHVFEDAERGKITLPDAHVTVYHDARMVEVERFGKHLILPVDGRYDPPGLEQKWRANLFLGRWLRYCLNNTYMLTELDRSA